MKNIEKFIKKGAEQGYIFQKDLAKDFFDDENYNIVEYNVVVNIAQELAQWNKNKSFKIYLEGSANEFYKNAFEDIAYKDNLFVPIYPEKQSPSRNKKGKIDIVIYEFDNGTDQKNRSKAAIEVKGLIDGYTKVYDDLDRLTDILEKRIENFTNSIEACYVVYMKEVGNNLTGKNNKDKLKILSNKELIKKKKGRIKYIKDKLNERYKERNITIKIEDVDIHTYSSEDVTDQDCENEGCDSIARKTKKIFAVLIEVKRL